MPETQTIWHDPGERPFRIAGFAWFDTDRVYRRMPLRPPYPLPPDVEQLAGHTAGGQIRFQTDSGRLSIQVRLAGAADMYHMPATGQCGFDCYIGLPGEQIYCSTTTLDPTQQAYEFEFYRGLPEALRNITLYFPLYQGVEEVRIGLEPGAVILEPPCWGDNRPIAVYGTSITQGACASRPGMAYTNQLSRRLNAEIVNLGFSGSGKGEAEAAFAVSEIRNPRLFVLDYEANGGSPGDLRRTLPEFIRILRGKHPDTPIVVLSKIPYARESFHADQAELRAGRGRVQREIVWTLRRKGDVHLHFQDGKSLLGKDWGECTVDGAHPTDLGFYRMAERLAPVLRRYLGPT